MSVVDANSPEDENVFNMLKLRSLKLKLVR